MTFGLAVLQILRRKVHEGRVHFLLRNERLSVRMKLTLHKAIVKPIMSYACLL